MASEAARLAQYLIPGTDEAFYIPDAITPEEEELLIRKIQESPLPKWKQLTNRRRVLQIWGGTMSAKGVLIPEEIPLFVRKHPDVIGSIRATGAFDSSPHGQPNHIIMNEYLPGQGIMPHEDGPAYHPVVATLSLGSHAVFHYYRYEPSPDSDSATTTAPSDTSTRGRAIDPAPIFSVLLEPRSLVITRSALYQTHLHGIDGVHTDFFPAPVPSTEDRAGGAVRIANADLLAGEVMRDVVKNGGRLARGPRYSLTCRDVARVAALPPVKR
ncbi:hypothetical protein FOMPIDRAFT_1031202 [Fomitopsis schrenkii]|uniref:Fe2OG dioxygenase domain-containing protein n=1 Tax=Fomitopsis schrenkii TaxID=2126942 RepID=S8E136_FOMSC|nr:hypothetical protein FOMPIDRAFT_1031202 [Fomitopsis schrenkii]